jgi:hypothetical protein
VPAAQAGIATTSGSINTARTAHGNSQSPGTIVLNVTRFGQPGLTRSSPVARCPLDSRSRRSGAVLCA